MTKRQSQLKQKHFQTVASFRLKTVVSVALCVFGIAGPLSGSQAQSIGIGSPPKLATLRLVAASGLHEGRYDVGVEIAMSPGSHTYWKNPGEAGVPPVFTFNGSTNVATATVEFPAPTRISEEGLDAFGYTGQVIFPVVVTPKDPSRPATLLADVTYAICNKICIPGQGNAKIDLMPHGDGRSPELVAGALAEVPKPAPAAADQLRITPKDSGATPSWTLTWTGSPPLADVIPDAPEGFYFVTKKAGPDSWILSAGQTVATGKPTSVAIALVLTGGDRPIKIEHTFNIGSHSTP